MKIKIFPLARNRIKEIRHYTKNLWGIEQAEKYVRGIAVAINQIPNSQHLWRRVNDDVLQETFFIRYQQHLIFFRQFSDFIGVINILHDKMDIPTRLTETPTLH